MQSDKGNGKSTFIYSIARSDYDKLGFPPVVFFNAKFKININKKVMATTAHVYIIHFVFIIMHALG